MKFSPNTIYHIYNQGNNRQRIFFKDGMGLAAGLRVSVFEKRMGRSKRPLR
ncbi:MAG: hypothetical protein R3D58_14445 [Saprospiraceae bacterium]